MAQEIREFAVTVPHGTTKANPAVTNISFPAREVIAVSWRVPPGPSGLMGWALTSAGTPVIPIQQGAYVVTDNQSATWDLEGYLDSGNWQVTAYNTGLYDHTVYLTFLLDLPGTVVLPSPPPTGSGVGVIGTGGTVIPPPASGPPPPVSSPPDDTAAAVTSAIIADILNQLQAAAAG